MQERVHARISGSIRSQSAPPVMEIDSRKLVLAIHAAHPLLFDSSAGGVLLLLLFHFSPRDFLRIKSWQDNNGGEILEPSGDFYFGWEIIMRLSKLPFKRDND